MLLIFFHVILIENYVLGVWFRVNTENKANELGARGWCENTDAGTVRGTIEAEEIVLNEM